MSRAEREEFLAGLHVGVLSVASPDGRGPLAAPVWYTYQPGGTVNVSTGRGTRKALAIEAAGRVSLCAQEERLPYKYVSVEGPVVMEECHRRRAARAGPQVPRDPRAATPTSRPTPAAPRS